MNMDKTKIMSNDHVVPIPVRVGNDTLEIVDNYVYLGQIVQLDVPTIRPTQSEIILQSGENYTIYCSGKSQIQFMHQDTTEEDITSDFYTEQRIVKDDESGYEVALDLVNLDRLAVGYYACFDGSVDASSVLANIVEEPHNTPHVSYIYVYVNGTDLVAPMRTFIVAKGNSKFIIECKPTAPDINVSLTLDFADVIYEHYSPRVGFTVGSDVPSETLTSIFICVFKRQGNIVYKDVIVYKHKIVPPPTPEVFGGSNYFLEGETFTLNCTVKMKMNSPLALVWKIPGSPEKVSNVSNEYSVRDYPMLYNNYTIRNASKEDAGLYECTSHIGYESKTAKFLKIYLEKPIIEMEKSNKGIQIPGKLNGLLRLAVFVNAYPPAEFVFLKDNKILPKNLSKVSDSVTGNKHCIITLRHLKVEDTGNYTVMAINKYLQNSTTYDIRVSAAPVVDFGTETEKKYLLNTKSSLLCEVTGYPLPDIEWIFTIEEGDQVIKKDYQHDNIESLYKIKSLLEIPVLVPGNITCKASNINGNNSSRKNFIVYEITNGFGIKKDQTWFSKNQNVELKCLASIFDFRNVTWYGPDFRELDNVDYTTNALSHVAMLKLDRISVNQAGSYSCIALSLNGTEEKNDTINITVAETRAPIIEDFINDGKSEEILPFHPVNFTCTADSVPPPYIEWFKDGEPLQNDTNVEILTNYVDHSTRYSIIRIMQMQEDNAGKYECRVTSHGVTNSKFYNLLMKEKATYKKTYLSIIGAIILVLLVLVVYLAWKIRKEKEFRKELAAAGLLNFKEGATKSINPDMGIDEQAELLPYDEKFEFPAKCLSLGKQLGAGAFGVVYKAEARGIIDAEKTTTVAVKMVKKTADNMFIKALASELKIMVHLGKHVNIVNLLGACTKNVGKRELIVIVEYCKFGNIHNYMQKHRDVFIDQFNDNPEKHMGKINRGYSSSSGNSGMHSDYYGSNHTQDTDHTLLNTANTNRSSRKQSETGYVQPEWWSNYESDYSFDGRSPRPLYTRDLLAWAFQIARGMEYLASRKVLHGDLAARNVLLADDNIVKICDFGLARSIYKNDEYQKQENSPLPVKWLAVECMTDRIFSTQSDVWSFGIVLWELFSLAKTPYPNVSPPSLLQWLLEGGRLKKPAYADDRIYELMKSCWEQKPTKRPTFTELQTILGTFLEDNVRNHYVDLDAAYMDMNTKKAGEEDYLAMVTAPDYNNLVTPSPHHYVNDAKSFFPPTQNQNHESETGYVQPEWWSNYESDYSFDGRSPRPLYTRDLLAWAFQIARGMEYLASRKVLHGDLAARNVLLADDNIVKICDFGLARSIYKNDEYQKQENSPLPVKWLAVECMTDRIFSTQSDVWSFGIVLWELFSLAKTPYPNVSPPSLLQWLLEGERLKKPAYADDRIYELMKSCWEQKPTKRPTFTELQTILGTFLEDNVRNHYVDLDAAYMDMNTKKAGEEDYLAMVTAPDYNNLVTPSPHHYVNDAKSFFPPTQNQNHEDEGYLQMSPATKQTIFNARPQGTKFDFDARKLTPRVSDANSYEPESTPMLTLNNLPRSGSESDQEGHSPPYHNVCPRIEEETDEVFETKQNSKNMQPNSITNPTYITMSGNNEKKTQNFTNNYTNVNIPNGLVK